MLNKSRFWLAITALIAGFFVSTAELAEAADSAFTTKAQRAILMDAETGAVLFQQNADQLAPPASMSKLMTLAVLFHAIKSGHIKLTDEFVMSVNAWRNGGAPSGTSAMMVPVNTKATVNELLQGIIVQSGNDAAMCIAEGMAGTEAAFARMMNEEARRIGLTKSTFANATGLGDPNHLMTARELAMLARYIISEYPDFYPLFAQKEFLYRKHRFINRNPLLSANIGADGLKTGHIAASGYGLVGSAVQDGKRLIVVVGGLEKAPQRKDEAVKLLDWGFKSFSAVRVFDEGEIIGKARVWGGTTWYVPLAAKGEVTFTLPKYPANQRLSAEIVYKAPLKPPVKKGDQVATLKISSSSSASTEVPLYATEDVRKGGIVRQGMDSLVLMALRRLAF
ncbi:MAG TPA: D-alanyl-D-alanine carboxypeptidase family protein [Hyphomicrobium sp.]|jgi:D-alanyl-D-alanine carboxypeptidase (penicillin-binding protein 5/6)|uniref:D-alanyl-D-alanine carboxypeptidase family protein n=1 Tax=Hyphomicrobium sp. TaxID=82 RepID=UPI002B6DBB27|nr:D-alanyl-D-alanine carboxypeptidase family protein [Hyphomicrobium sp.]HXE02595.1 D-alanyl-D-alanine carboxypeptidase family protein [Hyphomicrobium sp.]